ncbi:hypothetical protein EKD16_03565 [Streptomonospora litoralis]|uniref:DUF6542 domain-containing protein n=2 Tax=Streptomonospora litoralis TaxID=2498135 RepID=A0A4P6PWR8_9ACTN|nr:DUF6542 domain-containing protein [Streptomonospora litoralis]QBI52523.1 hypothetical protein EKD16_03565 [Streptomonospora litoralis]
MATRKPQRMDHPRAPFSVQRAPRGSVAPAAGTASEPAAAGADGRVRLTGRGGILLIGVVSLLSTLIAHLASIPVISGAAFTAACVVAALLVRPTDLLSLTVSPPLAYFTAALAAETALTLGETGFSRAVTIAMATRLADVAPSLFLGTALVLVIAVFRGLPSNIRTFSDEVNGRRPRTPPK